MESIVIEAAGETSAKEAAIARPQWPEESYQMRDMLDSWALKMQVTSGT